MAGTKQPRAKLTKTLLKIVALLKEANVNTWFITYGTLLGIVRGNECIDGDDDIDIICDIQDREVVAHIFHTNGFAVIRGDPSWLGDRATPETAIERAKAFLRIESDEYAPVDFSLASVSEDGTYHDIWDDIVWHTCHQDNGQLVQKEWKGCILQLPTRVESRLEGIYGPTWHIPQVTKEWDPDGTVHLE